MATVTGAITGDAFPLDPHAEIGRGAEGKVFRVHGGRCVKLLNSPLSGGDLDKLAALRSLSKKAPGFAWPLEPVADAAGAVVGYAQPLAAGETLESMLDGRATAALSVLDKAKLALRVAEIVAGAHALSGPTVVLGDVLKSANLVVDGASATFVDAASVSLYGHRLLSGGCADSVNRLSTPGSVPPEVLANPAAKPSHAADRFALAVVLFEVVFGRPPHEPRPCPAATGLDADEAVRRGVFPRYTSHPDFEPPSYDTDDVPGEIDDLFRAAFLSVTDRPPAGRWQEALARWVKAATPPPPVAQPAPVPVPQEPKAGWGLLDVLAAAFVALTLLVEAWRLVAALPAAPGPPSTPSPPAAPPPPANPVGPRLFQDLYR